MTKAEIADRVCRKLQATDVDSVALCKDFIKSRYEMIWHYALWRDSLAMQTIVCAAGQTILTLDPTFDFPVAVRWDSQQILPIDVQTVFSLDANLFDRTGTPTRFMVLAKDGSGNSRIQVLEIPAIGANVLVLAKKKLVPLNNDTDVPALTAIDNALLAHAEFDMLEYDRQYAKAQAKLMEAQAHLAQMREIETYQTARIQQMIPGDIGTDFNMSQMGYY